MCGIFGTAQGRPFDSPLAAPQPIARRLAHRGPDHTGFFSDAFAGLGYTRLAIIDIAEGNQPIFNEDESSVIVFNGEIYNHLDLRRALEPRGHRFRTHSDTETILHAFEEWGLGCLDRLDGMFAFAIWNRPARRLFLARDRLGIKPLYVARTGAGLWFASEPKALLPVLPGEVRPDWPAVGRYFMNGYFAGGDCAFAGIEKFPAGHYAWFDGSGFSLTRWWSPSYGTATGITFDQAVAEVGRQLEEAVERELIADVPMGVFLSGGLDSSAVALAAARRGRRLPSFALAFAEPTHDESADARRVAAHLGLEHFEHRLTTDELRATFHDTYRALDEPFGDSTVVPLLALARFARRTVKAVLTGWGGDEIFAGYPTYQAHLLAQLYRRLPAWLGQGILATLVRRLPASERYMSFEFKAKRFVQGMALSPEQQHLLWMGYGSPELLARLLTPRVREAAGFDPARPPQVPEFARPTELRLLDRIFHLDAATFLEGNGLFQADRITMAASLEARVPLLNQALVAYVSALPADLKMETNRLKTLLKSVLKPSLPAPIIAKVKKGFGPPSSIWLRTVLADELDKALAVERIRSEGIFVAEEVSRLVREHRDRSADHGRILWALMSFQLWYDQFVRNAKTP